MKFVVLLLVLVGALAWLAVSRRRRPPGGADEPPRRGSADGNVSPQVMVSCAHCGVHLPQADALFDPAGRPYCGEAHRRAGPRPGD
ncbi:MAG: PP0621 family protein [Betaproteobacteria bacterium]|jgi:uncharacterized protein|nr:PP0621 family protein [Rubrivivax sp.]